MGDCLLGLGGGLFPLVGVLCRVQVGAELTAMFTLSLTDVMVGEVQSMVDYS